MGNNVNDQVGNNGNVDNEYVPGLLLGRRTPLQEAVKLVDSVLAGSEFRVCSCVASSDLRARYFGDKYDRRFLTPT